MMLLVIIMNNLFKAFLIIIIIFFLIVYFSYQNGYYIDKNKEKMILTEEMIKEYEEDLKNGVDVTNKDYVVISDSYDNKYTRASLLISKKIENGISGVIKYFFSKISDTINE